MEPTENSTLDMIQKSLVASLENLKVKERIVSIGNMTAQASEKIKKTGRLEAIVIT